MAKTDKDTQRFILDSTIADQMLQNILNSCNIEPNDIPLNKLEVRHKLNNVTISIGKILSITLFIITLLVPLSFKLPKDHVTIETRAIRNLNLIDYHSEHDSLSFYLNSYFHIDLDSCYLETMHGKTYPYSTFIESDNCIIFEQPKEESIIYLYTQSGSLLKLRYKPIR